MVNYSSFANTDDVSLNISKMLEFCRNNNCDGVCFDKDVYSLTSDNASERFFSISNHGDPGKKKTAFLLEGMKDFVIDGGGSEFVFEDLMLGAALVNCQNVTLKNFSFRSVDSINYKAEVLESDEESTVFRLEESALYCVEGTMLYFKSKSGFLPVQPAYFINEYDKDTLNLADGAGDSFVWNRVDPKKYARCFEVEKGVVRIEGLKRRFSVGNFVVITSPSRCRADIFMDSCENIKLCNITLYGGVGMGVIAQNCSDIEIDSLQVKKLPERLISLNADATHFVQCKGKIHIHDCFFQGQLDDAMNVHGICLKVKEKKENLLVLGYMNHQTRGIKVFEKGDVAVLIDSDSLLSKGKFTVEEVKASGLDFVELVFSGKDLKKIKIGDCLKQESLGLEVIFERCVLENNRARGILCDGGGSYSVRDNIFRTPGTAILFEGDASNWFETVGGERVTVENNIFEGCCRGGWGSAVIRAPKRKNTPQNRYLCRLLKIKRNRFKDCTKKILGVFGFEELFFEENILENCTEGVGEIENCGNAVINANIILK